MARDLPPIPYRKTGAALLTHNRGSVMSLYGLRVRLPSNSRFVPERHTWTAFALHVGDMQAQLHFHWAIMCVMKNEARQDVLVRHEQASDIDAISKVTRAAFEHHPYSQQTEEYIVAALRASCALTISLVADLDGEVVGHAAFSPVTISDGATGWYGLGPISVLPKHQRQGIGKALMHEGLSLLKDMGANGCALVGDPAYYEQFGFRSVPELVHEGVPQENVLALHFSENRLNGTLVFHEGFLATGY